MTHKIRTAAAGLALLLALSTPAKAYSEELFLGTSDIPEEDGILTGTQDLPIYGDGDPFFAIDGEAMVMGISDAPEDVDTALENVISYLRGMSGNLVVGTEGGEWTALVLQRNGALPPASRETYLKNLMTTLNDLDGNLSKAKLTEYSRVILCLSALGMDPHNVGGYDLVAPLSNFGKVCLQGINGPIWALIALDSGNYEIAALPEGEKGQQTSREGILQHLLDNQYEDENGTVGGWSFSGNGLDDVNPMAIIALAPYYSDHPEIREAVDRSLQIWSTRQSSDGGFGDEGDSGNGGVEAICQTVIALSALKIEAGVDCFDQFTKNGNTLIDALLTYQAPDGSFRHTQGGEAGNAIATDQAAQALSAYDRAMKGEKSLYDMTDVAQEGNQPASPQEVEAFRQELYAVPTHPDLDDKDAINALQAKLSQMGDFSEKEEFAAQIENLKKALEPQEAEIKAWDADMTKIVPARLTLKDRNAVEALRERYNQLPLANRKYLQYAGDLIVLEEKLLQLDNQGFPILGEAKVPAGGGSQNGGSQSGGTVRPSGGNTRPGGSSQMTTHVTTTVESNTVDAKVQDGLVSSSELDRVKGQDRNLRMKDRLSNGKDYTMTVHGKDVDKAQDINIGIALESQFAEEIGKLSEEPFLFHVEHKGDFPAPVLVDLPVSVDDGLYMLLRYNEAERRAVYVAKPEVKNGRAAFTLEQGGDYFLAKKAISKSLDELEAVQTEPTAAQTAPTEAPTLAPAEAEITGTSMNVWLWAGIVGGVLTLALGIVVLVLLLNRRKV